MRELIETGLRSVIDERPGEASFVLSDASVGGRSLEPQFRNATWDQATSASLPATGNTAYGRYTIADCSYSP